MKTTSRLFALLLALALMLQVASVAAFAESIGVGDIDGNGAVDSADYAMLKNGFLSDDTVTGNEQKLSDINGDGIVDLNDVIALIEIIKNK